MTWNYVLLIRRKGLVGLQYNEVCFLNFASSIHISVQSWWNIKPNLLISHFCNHQFHSSALTIRFWKWYESSTSLKKLSFTIFRLHDQEWFLAKLVVVSKLCFEDWEEGTWIHWTFINLLGWCSVFFVSLIETHARFTYISERYINLVEHVS